MQLLDLKFYGIDGHNFKEIIEAFEKAKTIKEKPVAIIAKTIKGKGISFMENEAKWHGKAPKEEEYLEAIKELEMNAKNM